MLASYIDDKHFVVVAAFIKLRKVAFFCFEQPTKCIFCTGDVSHIVLVAELVFAFLYGITVLCCVSFHFCKSGVACNKMAELVVFFRIGVFAEINGAFYNCKIVFLLHCLTLCNLNNYYVLCKLNFLNGIDCTCSNGLDEVRIICINWLTFVLISCKPNTGRGLIVFLCHVFKLRSAVNGFDYTVGSCLCCVKRSVCAVNGTVFHGVGNFGDCNKFKNVLSVVVRIIIRTFYCTNAQRIYLTLDIVGESLFWEWKSGIRYERTALVYCCCDVFAFGKLFGVAFHLFFESFFVCCWRFNLYAYIFNVSALVELTEHFFILCVKFVDILVSNFNIIVRNRSIWDGSYNSVALAWNTFESKFRRNRIGKNATTNECLVLLVQERRTESFLNESPEFVKTLVIFDIFLRNLIGFCQHLVVLLKKLFELCGIEATGLLVYERSLHKHRICASF